MKRKVLIPIMIIALFIGGWLLLPKSKTDAPKSTSNSSSGSKTNQTVPSGKPELTIGNKDAKVTLFEYGDYKCPSCGKFHQEAEKQIQKDFVDTGKVKLVFRTYPYIGPDSGKAVRGAYCSNDQGKFSAYHDAVYNYMWDTYYKDGQFKYEIEDVLTNEVLTNIAGKRGINESEFSACVASDKFNKYVDADLLLAADNNVQGTPTFVLDGKNIVGPQPYSVFKSLLDIQLR